MSLTEAKQNMKAVGFGTAVSIFHWTNICLMYQLATLGPKVFLYFILVSFLIYLKSYVGAFPQDGPTPVLEGDYTPVLEGGPTPALT